MPRYGAVIDLKRCYGCYACNMACKTANHTPPGVFWSRLLKGEVGSFPNAVRQALPVLCMQCEKPSCMEVCPTGATQQREDGIVWIEQEKCTGCKNCIDACPYQIRTFYSDRRDYFLNQGPTEYEKLADKLYPLKNDIVIKCDFCMEKVDEGIGKGLKPGVDRDATPACVNICPAKSRYFGDLDDPESEVSKLIKEKGAVQLHPGFGTEPSVYYVYSEVMSEDRLISVSSYPGSARYSMSLFLMTAKQVHQDDNNGDGKSARSITTESKEN